MPHDINSQQSFDALPLKPNGQRKSIGARDRIPPDPAISKHELPSGVCRWSLPKHATVSMKTCIRHTVVLRERNPKTNTIIQSNQQPPRHQLEVEEKMNLTINLDGLLSRLNFSHPLLVFCLCSKLFSFKLKTQLNH
jgi:hypothetical protein